MEYKKSRDTLRSRVGTGPRVNQEKFTHYYRHLIHLLSEQLLFLPRVTAKRQLILCGT